jgi:peptidoglycan/LPS O-acetylase OafA/YrhL
MFSSSKPSVDGEASAGKGGRLTANDKIDLCRGIFAFLVVAAHAIDIARSIHPDGFGRCSWWWQKFLLYGVGAGFHWVIGFFVISGYCIQLSVSRSIDGSNFPLSRYLAARLSRILPLYFLGLIFAVIIEWLIAEGRPGYWSTGINTKALLAQLFLVQNLTQTFGSYAASWSITNEMFYYVFYGAIVSVAVKFGSRAPVIGMLLCLAVALPMDVIYFEAGRTRIALNVGLLFGLGAIWFLGALVADYSELLRRSRLVQTASRFWWAILAATLGLWLVQWVHMQVAYAMAGIAFFLMLVQFISAEHAAPRPTQGRTPPRIAEVLGLASYPTYLFHGPLLMLVATLVVRWQLPTGLALTYFVLVAAGVAAGIALGYLAERPIMRWRASLLNRLKSARSAAALAAGSQLASRPGDALHWEAAR